MSERTGGRATRFPRTPAGRILLPAAAAALLLLVLVLASAAGAAGTRGTAQSAMEAAILDDINAARAEHGLRPLRLAGGLERAAGVYVRTLASEGVFSHEAGGVSPSARIRRYYPGSSVGEVLLWRSPTVTPEQAVSAWLASPGHRAILLSGRYREIGLAAKSVASAPGYYGGRPVTIVVADLGAR